ncbi:Ragulator complex protein lamtor3 [Aphanomyces cochlioides]|nr:Ragulator complex protein lamtor3 [Aphanomyces cochlioides]
MEEKLRALLDQYEDLGAILVSTSDGVPLLKIEPESSTDPVFEYAETVLPSVFAAAAEQAGKLRFGNVQTITCFFGTTVLIHVNHLPVVITLIAAQGASVGALVDVANDLKAIVGPLKKVVETSDSN